MALDPRRALVATGTDMTILLGVVPETWGTPYDVYLHKTGLEPRKSPTHRMVMGTLAEPYIADLYAERTGATLKVGEFVMHDFYPVGGTPDRMIYDRAAGCDVKGLEIKKVGHDDGWGPDGSDEVPARVMVQCQTYMLVTGLAEWDVAALINEESFRVYHLKADPDLQNRIAQAALDFFTNHVNAKTPPMRGMAKMDPMVKLAKAGVAVENPSDPDMKKLGDSAHKLKLAIEVANEKLDALLGKIKERMAEKNYRGLIMGPWSATIVGMNYKPKTNYEKVALGMEEADPDLFKRLVEAHTTTPPPTTQFRFKAKPVPGGSE